MQAKSMRCYDTGDLMRLLLPLLACFVNQSDRDAASDRDKDGYIAWQLGGEDCDDGYALVRPGAPESCLDAIDSDWEWRFAQAFLLQQLNSHAPQKD